ncbi:transcription elongation factor GreB [Granulicella cerasi]|uniref:Transcription elongation factor GreB n=1 Tax=Granulicella cerasi TaxID=741063 RepID=A0ABW1Z7G9_9BACT|nr:transcription elongation factor GreB [Granulicella cerasi]
MPATTVRNYITPGGLERLKAEHQFLLNKDRPAVTEAVAWAASLGDRSENADYQYAKRRLRQIDGRIRFLSKRIEAADVIDPEAPRSKLQEAKAFFGATVLYENAAGDEREVCIVGVDEVDLDRNHVSWQSPIGRALMRSAEGDRVVLDAPGGKENLKVLEIRYERIEVEPFVEPIGSYASARKP